MLTPEYVMKVAKMLHQRGHYYNHIMYGLGTDLPSNSKRQKLSPIESNEENKVTKLKLEYIQSLDGNITIVPVD